MASNHNHSNTEDANSEIRKAHFPPRRTHEAAVRNNKIIASFKGDLGAAIEAQNYSPGNYGSEFCCIASLAKLFLHHEDKTEIINIIQQGSLYHLGTIGEET